MWNTYSLSELLLPTAAIFIVTAAVSLRVTASLGGAITAALIKSGLFLFYFSFLFGNAYVLLDDQSYIRLGRGLYEEGVGVFNVADHWRLILTTSGGPHIIYYLYNDYAIQLFGYGYYAPVALNIIVTVFMAVIGSRLAEREFGCSGPLRSLFFYYFILFPDVVAWSTIINDKDILVLFFHVALLYGFSLWFEGRLVSALMVLGSASFGLFFLCFYVPLLFCMAFLASSLFAGSWKQRFYWLGAGGLLAMWIVSMIGQFGINSALTTLRADIVNPVVGFVYFLLTPIPLNTDTNYAFLDIPAAIHWLLLPFVAIGAYKVLQLGTPFSRFFLFYIGVFTVLYATFGELQGPRHRVQLDFAWAIFQFVGLLSLVNEARRPRQVLSAEGAGPE